jgi:uncharacterized protein
MDDILSQQAVAFAGTRRIAEGPLPEVAAEAKRAVDRGDSGPILVFDQETSEVVELDLRGTESDVLRRLTPPRRHPGRPRLGVVPREVTLLPRHWDWLNEQPGGASVTLRKLVDQARRTSAEIDRVRRAREAAYAFIVVMAGNRPGFEEATRALFAGDRVRFGEHTAGWPADIRARAEELMARALDA